LTDRHPDSIMVESAESRCGCMNKEEKKIIELQTVLEMTKLLNSSNDVKYILNSMMNTTLNMMERVDIGVIFLYDKDSDILRLETAVGFGNLSICLKPGESITGIAFNSRKTLHLKNHEEMMATMGTMERSNFSLLESSISLPMETIQSSIACPLMHNDECIGVLVIDNYFNKEPLNEEDVYIAELISHHATIAIINAANYEKLIENQKSLEKYSLIVEEEKNKYEYSTFLHNLFTSMVLNGNSIREIVKQVSIILHRDVFIVDLLYSIPHYSMDHLTDHEQVERAKCSFLPGLSQHQVSVLYNEALAHWLYFNPILVNREVLGWVGVVSESPDFNELEKIAIDKCATIVALEMLKDNELSSMEQSLKGDFLDNLLADKSTEFMKKFAEKYHYNFNTRHQIIIMNIEDNKLETTLNSNLRYLYREINRLMTATFTGSITLLQRKYIITLFEHNRSINKQYLTGLMDKVRQTCTLILDLSRGETDVRLAVSEIIDRGSNFKEAFENAMKIFNLDLKRAGCFNYYFYEDLEVKRFLLNNDTGELKLFVQKILGPLLNYKNSSRRELYNTLEVYIKSGGNWTVGKEQLHIHGNTLTYRLNRLKDILDLDLSDYNDRLKIQIALEIIELYPK